MSRITERLPSPAMLVALFACVLALAGTASAAGGFGIKIFSHGAQVNTVGAGPLIYSSSNQFLPAGVSRTLTVGCPPNTRALGGGIRVSTGTQPIEGVVDSYPTNTGWAGTVSNTSGIESHTAVITAVCAKSLKAKGTIGGTRVK